MKKNRRIPRKFCIGTVILAMILTGCAGRQIPSAEPEAEGGKLNVVTTLFPYYDFTRQIAGEHINLTMVVPAGMDSHSFEPTPADMITIQNADVLICNGGAMEHWLERVLSAVDTRRRLWKAWKRRRMATTTTIALTTTTATMTFTAMICMTTTAMEKRSNTTNISGPRL